MTTPPSFILAAAKAGDEVAAIAAMVMTDSAYEVSWREWRNLVAYTDNEEHPPSALVGPRSTTQVRFYSPGSLHEHLITEHGVIPSVNVAAWSTHDGEHEHEAEAPPVVAHEHKPEPDPPREVALAA